MDRNQKWGLTILLLILSLFVTMSCYIRPLINPPDYEIDTIATLHSQLTRTERSNERNATATAIAVDHNASEIVEIWTIEQCNAIRDVKINLNDFNEVYYHLETDNNIFCDYNYKIANEGSRPIRLIHYELLFPVEEYSTPSRWVPFTIIQPEEYSIVYGWIDQCNDCTPSRHETLTYSLVLVYEIPECRWIIEGEKPHRDILYIAEEEPILAPCTLLSPVSYSDAVPDISEGLRP